MSSESRAGTSAAPVGLWWPPPLEISIGDLIAHHPEIGLTAADVTRRRYHRIVRLCSPRPGRIAAVAAE
ncbi:MAG: hypothetical protein M3O91_00550 [Chloroflexota bacterium]|nr:hypothetical protein [Chloroflexota bacterium]